jgi:hypothetical protein
MSLSFEQSGSLSVSLDKNIASPARRRWVVALWILSLVIGTTGWLIGLALAAGWLVQRAVS